YAAFLELHIEQNDQLEKAKLPVAIVDGFVGIRRYAVRFDGTANHAGTTPMASREDALVAAAPMIRFVRDLAVELGIVGTIGDFKVFPGAPNVIPERVDMIVEIRGLDAPILDQAQEIIQKEVETIGGRFETVVIKPSVAADKIVQNAIQTACQNLNISTLTMSSGAGHDAMNMALLCPQGMFFVPSKDGISHSKEEFTSAEDCVNGAKVLLETVLQLDAMLEKS
ncbi:MAG: hydantoinase/carbamoylase family amidase, partial [Chloroflexota bacterium]